MENYNPNSRTISIHCPKCSHHHAYDIDLKKCATFESKDNKEKGFDAILVCKNPLCNYDMEVIGNIEKDIRDDTEDINIVRIK